MGTTFEDDYFIYTLVDDAYNRKGWHISAKKYNKRFKCKSVYRGIPIISMSRAFYSLSNTEFDVSGMDVSNVTDFTQCFYYCDHLKSIDLSTWNLSNANLLVSMLGDNRELAAVKFPRGIEIDNCNTKCMFERCKLLKEIDMGGIKINHLESTQGMFREADSLRYLDIRGFNFEVKYFDTKNGPIDYTDIPVTFVYTPSLKCVVLKDKDIAEDVSESLISERTENTPSIVYGMQQFDSGRLDKLETKLNMIGKSNAVICIYIK